MLFPIFLGEGMADQPFGRVKITPASLKPCIRCGRCCFASSIQSSYVWMSKEEAAYFEEKHPGCTEEVDGKFYLRTKGTDGKFSPCMFLNINEDGTFPCSIYEDRPRKCREFRRGGNNCMAYCFSKSFKRGKE